MTHATLAPPKAVKRESVPGRELERGNSNVSAMLVIIGEVPNDAAIVAAAPATSTTRVEDTMGPADAPPAAAARGVRCLRAEVSGLADVVVVGVILAPERCIVCSECCSPACCTFHLLSG